MKSIAKRLEKLQTKLMKKAMNKKGQLGVLNLTKVAIIMFVVILITSIVGIVIAVSLRDAGIFAEDTVEFNQTTAIVNNYSQGIAGYWVNFSTLMTILFIVALIGFIGLILFIVNTFGRGASTTNAGL